MKSTSILITAAAFGLCILCVTRNARALGPVDLELGGKIGVGSNPNSSGPNPLGFGLGARGGISLAGFYGGASVIYYFGSSQDVTAGGVSLSESVHSLLYGFEGGYGVKLLDLLTLRAQLGIGNATFTASASGQAGGATGGGSVSNSNLYLEPGAVAMVSLGSWFVGGDANVLILPGIQDTSGQSTTETAITFHGQIGWVF